MKIAIVTPVFSIAGVPLAQHRFARALVKKGHEVELIVGFLPSNLPPPQVPLLKINILDKSSVTKMFPSLIRNQERRLAKERAEYLLHTVGMQDRMHHTPGELSGGENQRVALARGLVNQPELLLADEPTGNLDHHASDQLIDLIQKLNQEFSQTFVIVTHSQRVANRLDRLMELVDGKVIPTNHNLVM